MSTFSHFAHQLHAGVLGVQYLGVGFLSLEEFRSDLLGLVDKSGEGQGPAGGLGVPPLR